MVAVIILGGVFALIGRQQEEQSITLEANASRRVGVALSTIDEAVGLQDQIDALNETGDIGSQDYDFLLGNPAALVNALQSVYALQVEGIVILSIATEDASLVSARLSAASNAAAFEWRRLIGSSAGVSRVLSFDPVLPVPLSDELIYDVTLISGSR